MFTSRGRKSKRATRQADSPRSKPKGFLKSIIKVASRTKKTEINDHHQIQPASNPIGPDEKFAQIRANKRKEQTAKFQSVIEHKLPEMNKEIISKCLEALPFLSEIEEDKLMNGLGGVKKEGEKIFNACHYKSYDFGMVKSPAEFSSMTSTIKDRLDPAQRQVNSDSFKQNPLDEKIDAVLSYITQQYRMDVAQSCRDHVMTVRYPIARAAEKKAYTDQLCAVAPDAERSFIAEAVKEIYPMSHGTKINFDWRLNEMKRYKLDKQSAYKSKELTPEMMHAELEDGKRDLEEAKNAYNADGFARRGGSEKTNIVLNYLEAAQKISIIEPLLEDHLRQEAQQKQEEKKYYTEEFTKIFSDEEHKGEVRDIIDNIIPLSGAMRDKAFDNLMLMDKEKGDLENQFTSGRCTKKNLEISLKYNKSMLGAIKKAYNNPLSQSKELKADNGLNYIKALHSVALIETYLNKMSAEGYQSHQEQKTENNNYRDGYGSSYDSDYNPAKKALSPVEEGMIEIIGEDKKHLLKLKPHEIKYLDDQDLKLVTKAYRTLSLKHHPDKPNGDEEMFKELGNIYQPFKDEIDYRRNASNS